MSTLTAWLHGWAYRLEKLPRYYRLRLTNHRRRIERIYLRKVGRRPDFDAPRTFTEKLGWMKLYDHDPIYTRLVDKVAVREYVRERIGEEFLVPMYGVWDTAEAIPFDTLPLPCILKTNHESGFYLFGRNGAWFRKDGVAIDHQLARAMIATHLRMNYYYKFFEWPYRDVPPRVHAEQLLIGAGNREPAEYKFWCFGGKPRFILVEKDRHTRYTRALYLPEWEPSPFSIRIPSAAVMPRPANLPRLLEVAAALAHGLRFCRVDLYDVDGRISFNEMTLLPTAGFGKFIPDHFDYYWGEQLYLSGQPGA